MTFVGYEIFLLLILIPFVCSAKLTSLESQQLRWTCGMSLVSDNSTQKYDGKPQTWIPLSYGGHLFNPMAYPWVVIISKRDKGNFCSGALISSCHVLTAAHCVVKTPGIAYTSQECREKGYQNTRKPNAPIEKLVITIGSHCEEPSKCPSFRIRRVRSFHVPNDFDECTTMNDIAILELEKDVPQSVARPICLPRANTRLARNLKAAGNGAIAPYDFAPTRPYQVVNVQLVATPKNKTIITTAPKGVGICDGDSGGPLFQTDHYGRSTIVGVVSNGNTCFQNYRKLSTGAFPFDDFTDVRQNLDWICIITGICHERSRRPWPSPPRWEKVFWGFIAVQYPLDSLRWCSRRLIRRYSKVILTLATILTVTHSTFDIRGPSTSFWVARCFVGHSPLTPAMGPDTFSWVFDCFRIGLIVVPSILLFAVTILLIRTIKTSDAPKLSVNRHKRVSSAFRNTTVMLTVIIVLFLLARRFCVSLRRLSAGVFSLPTRNLTRLTRPSGLRSSNHNNLVRAVVYHWLYTVMVAPVCLVTNDHHSPKKE